MRKSRLKQTGGTAPEEDGIGASLSKSEEGEKLLSDCHADIKTGESAITEKYLAALLKLQKTAAESGDLEAMLAIRKQRAEARPEL